MTEKTPSQAKTVELTKNLRDAIKQNQLENVFKAAGASKITGQATEVLGETTAAHLAPLYLQSRFKAPGNAPAPEGKLVQVAQEGFDSSKLAKVLETAGVDPKQGIEMAGREMARIAQGATEFARAEGRPLCHNCSAVGAARAAAQYGSQPVSR